MIAVVDYRLGNLGSIANMFGRIGARAVVTGDPAEIARATKIVLPGVGAFDNGMSNLSELGLVDVLNHKVLDAGVPTLGICLGAQLMTRGSEEGSHAGLGWIEAVTVRFRPEAGRKVPHMGWCNVRFAKASPLFDSTDTPRFYFVHSYHFDCRRPQDVLATATYGYEFPAAFSRGNIVGMQFHPEKSHRFGLDVLKRFAAL
jgi:glutamine amidotransferase